MGNRLKVNEMRWVYPRTLYGVMKTDQIRPHETISKCNNSGKKDHREKGAEDGRRKRAKKGVGCPDSKKLMKRKTEDQEETPE